MSTSLTPSEIRRLIRSLEARKEFIESNYTAEKLTPESEELEILINKLEKLIPPETVGPPPHDRPGKGTLFGSFEQCLFEVKMEGLPEFVFVTWKYKRGGYCTEVFRESERINNFNDEFLPSSCVGMAIVWASKGCPGIWKR